MTRNRWALLLAAVSLVLNLTRIDVAPDIHGDEIMYYQAGTSVAREGRLAWLENVPVWVHPPLFFLTEAAVVTFLPEDVDIFHGIHVVRGVGAVFGALTTAALFLLVAGAFGVRAGIFAAGLFLLDPFVLRICRRIMLESQMQFFLVAGLLVVQRAGERLTWGRGAAAAVLFGLALLTKEIALFAAGSVFVHALLARSRALVLGSVAVLAGAVIVWSAYPVWAAATGQWEELRAAKWLGAE
ncbi:MAG: phospholipid carrier-dependent glycosyltransferase, partial [Gemmatimonadetes bacterium]|nr:phospholipid carrier-dependent glycosyltransferase [Gemmatimonadota bacterium]